MGNSIFSTNSSDLFAFGLWNDCNRHDAISWECPLYYVAIMRMLSCMNSENKWCSSSNKNQSRWNICEREKGSNVEKYATVKHSTFKSWAEWKRIPAEWTKQ